VRKRLLAALVGLTLLTVLLYAVPRSIARVSIVTEDAQADVAQVAQMVAEVLDTRSEAGLPSAAVRLDFLPADDEVVLRSGDDVEVLAGTGSGEGGVVASAPVAAGGTVEVRRPGSAVRQDVLSAVRPIVLTGLAALAVAVLAAVVLSARLARPFQVLAGRASLLGSGDVDVDLPPLPVREAEAIAAALRASSARVTLMLQREREFARNASHQLRTPLTSVRLRVEDLKAWPETADVVRTELDDVLREVDRLSDTVTALLAFARDERMGAWEPVRLDDVLAAAAARWAPLVEGQGRVLDVAAEQVVVPVPRVAVDQVLDVLVDNALKHGRGTVSVAAAADERSLRFLVADEGETSATEGRRLPERHGPGSTGEGIGLTLARDLVEVLGGSLTLARSRPTTFELTLPGPREDSG
jgi:signal transduction histidine kinase